MQKHELLTVKEVATFLRVSRVTVWRWCKQGVIPASRLGRNWRIRRADVLGLLEGPIDLPVANPTQTDDSSQKNGPGLQTLAIVDPPEENIRISAKVLVESSDPTGERH